MKRNFSYGARKSRPQPQIETPQFETFEELGEKGLRCASENFREILGDGFAVGILSKDLEAFQAALEAIVLRPPSSAMSETARQLLSELKAPELPGVNAIGTTARILVIDRKVDYSGPLPRVTGCEETRVLTILSAFATARPALLATQLKMLRASGIPLKVKMLSADTVRFDVFNEILDVRIGRAD